MFIGVMNTTYLVLDYLHTNEAGRLPSVLHPIVKIICASFFLLDCELHGSLHVHIGSTDVCISQNDLNQQPETFRLSSRIRFIYF